MAAACGRAVRACCEVVRGELDCWISGTSTANHKEHKAHKERTKTSLPVLAAPPGETRARLSLAARFRRSARRDAGRAGEIARMQL